MPQIQKESKSAYTLYFDGAFQRKTRKGSVGICVLNSEGLDIITKGKSIGCVNSNNEAEYTALIHGLKFCLKKEIQEMNVRGDSLLVISLMQGTWQVRN